MGAIVHIDADEYVALKLELAGARELGQMNLNSLNVAMGRISDLEDQLQRSRREYDELYESLSPGQMAALAAPAADRGSHAVLIGMDPGQLSVAESYVQRFGVNVPAHTYVPLDADDHNDLLELHELLVNGREALMSARNQVGMAQVQALERCTALVLRLINATKGG